MCLFFSFIPSLTIYIPFAIHFHLQEDEDVVIICEIPLNPY